MLPFLIFTRVCIIWWVTVSLMPIENAYDAIDAEIVRHGGEAL